MLRPCRVPSVLRSSLQEPATPATASPDARFSLRALYCFKTVCASGGLTLISRPTVSVSATCRALTGLPPRGSRSFLSRASHAPKTFFHRRGQRVLSSARMSVLYAPGISRPEVVHGRIYLFKGQCRGTVAELPCRSLDDTSVLKTYSIYRCPIWICFHSENFPLSGIRWPHR